MESHAQDNTERQMRELERENEQLSQALDNIRERSEKTSDVRVSQSHVCMFQLLYCCIYAVC